MGEKAPEAPSAGNWEGENQLFIGLVCSQLWALEPRAAKKVEKQEPWGSEGLAEWGGRNPRLLCFPSTLKPSEQGSLCCQAGGQQPHTSQPTSHVQQLSQPLQACPSCRHRERQSHYCSYPWILMWNILEKQPGLGSGYVLCYCSLRLQCMSHD